MPEERNYWLITFTGITWNEFLNVGANTYGLKDWYETTASKTKLGDYLICYMAGVSRFVGLLEVKSAPFRERKEIWTHHPLFLRLRVEPIILLTPETGIPVTELKDQLSMFQNLKSPSSWAMHFRNALRQWKEKDANAVIAALKKAEKKPIKREVEKVKLSKQPT